MTNNGHTSQTFIFKPKTVDYFARSRSNITNSRTQHLWSLNFSKKLKILFTNNTLSTVTLSKFNIK